MAYEITPWKQPECDLAIDVSTLTQRETYSREINEQYGEGGGLNANYRTVEAVAIVASILAANGLRHGVHWVFKTGSGDSVGFDFCNDITKIEAEQILLLSCVKLRRA